MSEIVGVSFPIEKRFMNRFFNEGKTVFIKPATAWKELKSGMKFVFYQSHEDTGFVGEGKIVDILLVDDPRVLTDKYKDQLFLTREEIKTYISDQKRWKSIRVRKDTVKRKKWMAIELNDIRQYPKIKKPARFVPISGQYLRE